MELWLDTTNTAVIKTAQEMNLISGVTTNPSILASTERPPMQVLAELLAIQTGFVAIQVTAQTLEGIIKQAQQLYLLDRKRIIIKVPVTDVGLKAMAVLRKKNIPFLATTIYNANQLLLAGLAGAHYAAPYLGGIAQANQNHYIDELSSMLKIIKQQKFNIKIMAAAIKDTQQITVCAELGVAAVTLPADIFEQLTAVHPLTKNSLQRFDHDWKAIIPDEVFAY